VIPITGNIWWTRFTGKTIGSRGASPAGSEKRRRMRLQDAGPHADLDPAALRRRDHLAPVEDVERAIGSELTVNRALEALVGQDARATGDLVDGEVDDADDLEAGRNDARVVTGAASPNSATKASPSKPKSPSREKSKPFLAA
jgi:hypothetical protein